MPRRFRARDAKPDPRRDVDDELRYHLDMRAEEFAAQGLPPDEARRAAAAAFGDVTAVAAVCVDERERRERVRRWRTLRWDLAMDVRYALRTLRRSPLFATAAVLTLALGIGGAAAVFTLVSGVLLRPLPYADPSRLVMVWTSGEGAPGSAPDWPLSPTIVQEVRAQTRTLASMAAFRSRSYALAAGDATPEMLSGAKVEPALFATLGVRPLVGRGFVPDEAREGGDHVAVLGYELWRRRFGGDTSVVGRTVTLGGEPYTVVGVMPRDFAFPRGAELPPELGFAPRAEIWTPLVYSASDLAAIGTLNLSAVARLRPDATLDDAHADLARVRQALLARYPRVFGTLGLRPVSLAEQAARPVRRGLLLLMAAVGVVLVIACANVTNLLVARAARREREFATRTALGATRPRVFLQLAVENTTLALAGGALGLGAAALGASALRARLSHDLPRADDVTVDLRVIAATVLAALLVGLVFAAATAANAGGRAAGEAAGTRVLGTRRQRTARRALVSVEVALSLVLLVSAGLLTRSFVRLQRTEPGFDPRATMTAGLLAGVGAQFDIARDGSRWQALYAEYLDRLAAQPGVAAAGAVSALPLSGTSEFTKPAIDGKAPDESTPSVSYNVAGGDYFTVMRIPVLAGRAFDRRDVANAPPAVVVSAAFARRFFPGVPLADVVGHRVGVGFMGPEPRTIVGVVGDVRQSTLDAAPTPAFYMTIAQAPYPFLTIVARARSGDPATVLPRMRASLAAVTPTLALSNERALDEVVAASVARRRFALTVTGAFAGVALVLSAIGLYAVIATSVAQRARELGVRLALGATPGDVRALVLHEGMRVVAVGIVVGIGGALAIARVIRGQLYEVSTTDPVVYLGVALVTAAVALAATWLPARRATMVDPVTIIRGE